MIYKEFKPLSRLSFSFLLALIFCHLFCQNLAQADLPRVGRKAAAKYFQKDVEPSLVSATGDVISNRILQLHVGKYIQSQAYQWKGDGKREDVAQATYGMTYLLSDWNSVDVNIRGDFSEYLIDQSRYTKLSLLTFFSIPQAFTFFPLYFAFGIGPGIFFNQIEGESNLSIDYQLVAGARFFRMLRSTGFFIEYGLKNHVHILSDGQLNGTFLSLGTVFDF